VNREIGHNKLISSRQGFFGWLMNSRDYFLIACLLASGTILRFILVLFNEPLTPNVLVAFYGIAIMAIGLSFGQSLALGLIAGGIMALISHSVLNPAFLVSEPVGAVVCLGVFLSLPPSPWRAGLSVFIATVASGIIFSVLALSLGQVTVSEIFYFQLSFLATFFILILLTALADGIIAGLLFPRARAFRSAGR
jgi:hypothetical protein